LPWEQVDRPNPIENAGRARLFVQKVAGSEDRSA
jgi:hypothetical protein